LPKDRDFQGHALRHIDEMKAASAIFDAATIDLAQEMIRDTQAHDARTVGQLLAFMRKYRLMFAAADRGSVDVEGYTLLYGGMRDLKEKMGLKAIPDELSAGISAGDDPALDQDRHIPPAEIVCGKWVAEGNDLVQKSFDFPAIILFGNPEWSSYTVRYKFKREEGTTGPCIHFHVNDLKNMYGFAVGNYNNTSHDVGGGVNGEFQRQPEMIVPGGVDTGRWYEVRVDVFGSKFRCYLDGRLIFQLTDERFAKGRIGLSTKESVVRFRDIRVTSPDGKLIWRGPPRLP
jgi:hypothetical protein